RHTRFSRDWSSDVCSSDLVGGAGDGGDLVPPAVGGGGRDRGPDLGGGPAVGGAGAVLLAGEHRAEEERGLDGLEVVVSHGGPGGGLEPAELPEARLGEHGGVAARPGVDQELTHPLEVPADGPEIGRA